MASKTPKTLKDFLNVVVAFRDARDWKQFHNPKDMSLSLILEAAELMEHFQWKNGLEMEKYIKEHKSEIAEEVADVLYWVLLIAHDLHIDLDTVFMRKIRENDKKYPVEKSKGKYTKYTKL